MTRSFRNDPTYLTELPADLRYKRREAARRRRWRRRLVALALVAVAGAGIAFAVTRLTGGSSRPTAGTSAAAASSGASPSGASAAYPPDWTPHPGPVPILEYHAIQPPVAGAADPELFVPQADFQRQMAWLRDNGYEGVTLDQVEAAWYQGGRLPPKPVVVSFDDGYLSQFVAAFPELRNLGWKGVLNVTAQGSGLPDADLRRMLDAGWELASHSITHPDLTTLAAADLRHEVAGSRQILRARFGVPVDNFAYPAGSYDATVVAAVRAAGYTGAETEVPGMASRDRPFELRRIEVLYDDGLGGFVAKLRGAESAAASPPGPSG